MPILANDIYPFVNPFVNPFANLSFLEFGFFFRQKANCLSELGISVINNAQEEYRFSKGNRSSYGEQFLRPYVVTTCNILMRLTPGKTVCANGYVTH